MSPRSLPLATLLGGLLAGGASPCPAVAAGAPQACAGLLLVANKGDHTLSIVDPAAGRQLAAVREGGETGHEVAASPDGRRAYVPVYGSAGVGQADRPRVARHGGGPTHVSFGRVAPMDLAHVMQSAASL